MWWVCSEFAVGVLGTYQDISDRKNAEIILQRQLAAIEAAVDGIAILEDMRFVNINTSHVRMFGYENAEELVGQSWRVLYSDQELERFDVEIFPALFVQKFWQGEVIGTRKDGTTFIEQISLTLSSEDLLICVCQDISDRKQVELALQQSEQRYATLTQAAPVAIFRFDLEGQCNYVNDRWCEMTQKPISFAMEGRWLETLHPDDRERSQILFQQWFHSDTSIPFQNEARILRDDGSIIWYYCQMVSEFDTNGEITGYVGSLTDISDRKQVEMALQESETQFRRVFDSNVVGMLFADFSGLVTDANDCFLNLIGYSYADLKANRINWAEITPPEFIEADNRAVDQLLCFGEITPWEKQYLRPDGSRVWVLIGVAMLSREEGRCVCVVLDISDRKAAELLIRQQANRETVIREITQRIRQSLSIQTIFVTACQEIRQELEADRVGIFKFYPNSHWNDGEFVSESVVQGFPSAMAIRVHDHCFGDKYAPLYLQGRYSATEDIFQLGDKCHSDVLAQFQVRANLVIPLLDGDNLWGLLCIHQCSNPRQWQSAEVILAQQLANQLAIAIQQANLYDQVQTKLIEQKKAERKIAVQLQRQQALATITQLILQRSLDLENILATVVQQVKEILNGDRVIIFQLYPDGTSRIVEEAVSDGLIRLRGKQWNDEVWSPDILECYWQGQPRIVPDVMNDRWTECLVEYSLEGQIQSKIVAPILQESKFNESHRWVSPCDSSSNKVWGVIVIHACTEKRVWKETEAQLLQQIANQVAIAIQQANLFEQLQRELTERQQAQAQLTETNHQLAISNIELERATHLKDEFLANMSHELRTPLNAILGMTEGLQEEVFGIVNEKQLKALNIVEKSAFHLLTLINDILDVAKIESGNIKLEPSPVSIEQLCSSSLTFVKQQALKKRIQLETKIPPHLPDLFVDETRMRQVLLNLLTNAVKFTPEGGQITLTVNSKRLDTIEPPPLNGITRIRIHRTPEERDLGIRNDEHYQSTKHYIQITITDTGIGIAPENINKLFKPFIQIDSALNRQYSGTGLGLALVKSIVELHGGNVTLTSELGKGSCFTINLPYHSQVPPENLAIAPESEPSQPTVNQQQPTKSPLVLLAEDNPANVATVTSYLEAKGFRILCANDGQEAIDLAISAHPDVILMDVQMPEVDGLEAMRQIRQQESLRDIPIIALTALAMKEDQERCLAAGASHYLSKPVRLKQLSLLIQDLL